MDISGNDAAVLDRIFNPLFPDSGEPLSPVIKEIHVEETEIIKEVKRLELDGVQAAENGNIDTALDCFNKAVQLAPEWPSAHNNRAQLLRLKGDTEGAKQDLDAAIRLSNGEGKAAAQAFTQRGLIRQYEGNTEEAVDDYKKAAHLGCSFAKHQLASLNPYAAMCNQMLSEVIGKLQNGET